MKNRICLVLIFFVACVPLFLGAVSHWAEDGTQIRPTYSASPSSGWTNIGSITTSQDTLTAGSRTYSYINSTLTQVKTVRWDIPDEADNLELRFHTNADGDDHVIEMYFARGATYTDGSTADHYVLTNILTLEGGTQTGANSNVFCDVVTETQDYGVIGSNVTGGNRIGRYIITKLRGYKKLVIIATTLQGSTTLEVDAAWYSNED